LRDTKSDEDARQLYDLLVGPVQSSLEGRTRVVIVPDFVLHSLPFGMLRRGERALLQDFVISYAPSSSVLATLVNQRGEARTAPHDFIGLAPICTELPETRTEVEEIAALFTPGQARISVGADMTRDTLQAMGLRDYRYVHFATHGIVNEHYPDGSAILLSADGSELLRPSEVIRDFPLDAEMVVLSACDTGRGALSKGEGILGLMRAFFSAGARSVCATLWPVNDRATARLMVAFYRHLRAGLCGAEALREAQLELANGRDFAWPGFWAPFIFAGPPTNA
jgi:CHAT domain-containing protein